MELTFQIPDFAYSLDRIMEFQGEGETAFWSDSLYYFYPQLDQEHAKALSEAQRREYLGGVLAQVYRQNEKLLADKAKAYQRHWQCHRQQITEVFSEEFERDLSDSFEDLTGNLTLNPIGPRFLETHSFDLFYLNSERGALGCALHEIVHFLWFDLWQQQFGDDPAEYERPHLKWILSEMTVETYLRDERLRVLNPYFQRDYEKHQNGCVYGYFYTMELEGHPVLETLHQMRQGRSVTDYMACAYEYCQRNEAQIRQHIWQAEQGV